VHQPVIHDARFQVASDQLEQPLVMHPSCDPGHQCVVLNAIEERFEIKINAPHRAVSDELACPLHSLMLRAPRPKAEAMGMKLRIEDWCEHLRDGLADHPIHRSRHPQLPHPARGLGDHHPAHRLRPVGARLER
jgi:DNA polymerase III epsilon subunit-like protein